MDISRELKIFVRDNLIKDLEELEEIRKKVKSKLIFYWFIVLFIFIVFSSILGMAGGADGIYFIGVMAVIACLIVYAYVTRNYISDYKERIIKKIVKFVDPSLHYQKENKVTFSSYNNSKLFLSRVDSYKGEDHVSGKIGETSLEFSELYTTYTTGTGKNKRTVTVFKGLFFVANFNKKFKTETFVLPDRAEKMLGFFGKKLQEWGASSERGELVNLEDPEFENLFVVYGKDQVEARYILSPSLMQRIISFRNKTGKNISLSFVDNTIYIATPYKKDLFEPRVFKTIINLDPIQEYYEDIKLMVDIVNDLNLNLRIWG